MIRVARLLSAAPPFAPGGRTDRPFWSDLLLQTAVYWPPRGVDRYGGRAYGPPREFAPGGPRGGVRWREKTQLVRNGRGEEVTSSAAVLVDADLEEGGRLWPGALPDLTDDQKADPASLPGSREIVSVSKTPDLYATDFLRRAYL